MRIIPSLLPYRAIIYQTNSSKGRIIAILRNEQAVLRQQDIQYPLQIELKEDGEFTLLEKFQSGGQGLTSFNCILRSKGDAGTELEARIIPHQLLKLAFQVWTTFLLLALAAAIASLFLGIFYNRDLLLYLWMIVPSGFMIFFIAMGVRKLLTRQIQRYQRIIKAMLQPYKTDYQK